VTLLREDTLPHKADEHCFPPLATGEQHKANETPASVTLSSPVKEHAGNAGALQANRIFRDRFEAIEAADPFLDRSLS
jgi:hypothetical protein